MDSSRVAQLTYDPMSQPACESSYNYPTIALLSGGVVLAIVLSILLIRSKNISKKVRILALVCIGLFAILWLAGLILGRISLTDSLCAL